MIADARAALYAHFTEKLASTMVHLHLPDDVNEVPCVVVGRPALQPDRTPLVDRIGVPVYVVGRRLSDDESQFELDSLADQALLAAFARIEGLRLAVEVLADPSVVQVAGQDFPAYTLTLTMAEPRPCGD